MHTRIIEDLRELVEAIRKNPRLQEIIDEDANPELNLLLQDQIHDKAFLVGYDFLALVRKTTRVVDEGAYDLVKVRRRLEEHLRKYANERILVGLALFFGIPIK